MIVSPAGLAIILAVELTLLYLSHLSPVRSLRESRGILVLIALIVLASAVGRGDRVEAVGGALVYGGRLVLLVLSSHVFIGTTTVADLKTGVARLLRFLPGRAAWSVSTMIAIAVAFVPLPLSIAYEISLAAASRGFRARRHPIRYTRLVAFTLVVRTLLEAESRSQALELRGGSGHPLRQTIGVRNWGLVAVTLVFAAVAAVV